MKRLKSIIIAGFLLFASLSWGADQTFRGNITGNAATVTGATFTTTLTNQGGAGVLAWPAAGATLTIPSGGGTLATGAFATIADYALKDGSNFTLTSQAVGDLFYASSGTAITRLADVAAGQPLLSGGVTTAPAYAGYTFVGTAAQTYTFPTSTATLVATSALRTDGAHASNFPYINASGNIEDATIGSGLTNTTGTLTFNPVGSGMIERVGATFDGGGSAIAQDKIAYVYMPFGGAITKWTLICNTAEDALIIDILRLTKTADTLPTASMVGAGNKPTATHFETQVAPNGSWTSTTIVANDVLGFKVTTGAATATWCHVSLDVTR